jgi:hypothetical protein
VSIINHDVPLGFASSRVTVSRSASALCEQWQRRTKCGARAPATSRNCSMRHPIDGLRARCISAPIEKLRGSLPPKLQFRCGSERVINWRSRSARCHEEYQRSRNLRKINLPGDTPIFTRAIMTVLKENRTLQILNAAAAGKYGVLAAIAYASMLPLNLTTPV